MRRAFFNFSNWPVYLAIFAGLIVSCVAWNYQNEKNAKIMATVNVVVPKQDIEAYSLVTAEKLTIKKVRASNVDKFTARDINLTAGMVTTAPLYSGKVIDSRYLVKPSDEIGRMQVVGVKIDAARAAGVRTGDIVDVYWLTPEQGAWSYTQGSRLIAQNVRVLRVCDERGEPLPEQSGTIQSAVGGVVAPIKEPRIVFLLVNPGDVSKIIGGSAEKNASIALARKSSESNAIGGDEFAESLEAREGQTAGGAGASAGEPAGGGKTGAGASVQSKR